MLLEFSLDELEDISYIVSGMVGPRNAKEYPAWGRLRGKLVKMVEVARGLDTLAKMQTSGVPDETA